MRYDGVFRNEAEVFEWFRFQKGKLREDGTMAAVHPDFIKNLQGKEFVLYDGLRDVAHKEGLTRIKTDLIKEPSEDNGHTAIVKATAYKAKRLKDKEGQFTDEIMELEFDGLGDASPVSVSSKMAPHIIRMAETRAKARALRDLTNIAMVAIEELGPDMDE